MSDTIEIISWNVNGIRAVANKEALKWVEERQPDILCFQEIKATEDQIPDNLFDYAYHTRVVNPGALGGTRRQSRSFCLLDLSTGEIEFVELEDRVPSYANHRRQGVFL